LEWAENRLTIPDEALNARSRIVISGQIVKRFPFIPLSPPSLSFFLTPSFPSFSPSLLLPSLPSEVGPLNPAKGSGSAVSSPSVVCGEASAEIEFGAFSP